MNVKPLEKSGLVRWRISVTGTVQGVGFRPFIYQLAHTHALTGWVRNTGNGVVIEAEGFRSALLLFVEAVVAQAPPLARITDLHHDSIPLRHETGFFIVQSDAREGARAAIPPDIATCPACSVEIADPANLRYRYPFTNCTNCGPRFTIITAIPYDRPHTTMRDFPMCPSCRAEYGDPANRRFHAQPNACPVCGPHVHLHGTPELGDSAAIAETARLLKAGRIIAIKGLGGYHLACDARNREAVQTLRARKGRGGKPFALMCRDMAAARSLCFISLADEQLLFARERPIVLLPARPGHDIAPEVAPGVQTLGIMLPYTPLHQLLLEDVGGPLVMTSGNISDEPIAFRDADAMARLGGIADDFLLHNRPIHIACDDSVVRAQPGGALLLRRARGYVPTPIELDVDDDLPELLACGGDLKNTFCVTKGRSALLSQHLGDLDNAETVEQYQDAIAHFCRFYEVHPDIIVHDLHPDYRTTRLAQSMPATRRFAVQHHHAHIASCMADNRLTDPVIGLAFDGTGYGEDGVIWGGEFLIADYAGYHRVAHLAEIGLPGGEAAIKRPGRIALAWLQRAGLTADEISCLLPALAPLEVQAASQQLVRNINCPRTTSMGRFFDMASALLGICHNVTYEGQAAIELETTVLGDATRTYPWQITRSERGAWILDPHPVITAMLDDLRQGVSEGQIAARIHHAVVAVSIDICHRLRDEYQLEQVAVSGGVFQNLVLLNALTQELRAAGFEVFTQQQVPCNDGGLSFGQAMIAAALGGVAPWKKRAKRKLLTCV